MPNAPKTPARAVRISDEMWAALRDVADRENERREREGIVELSALTVSDVIRLALADFLARH